MSSRFMRSRSLGFASFFTSSRMRTPMSIAMQTPRRRGLKVESRYVLAFRRSNQASPYDSPSATSLMRGR